MKRILLALMVALTVCALANAQNRTIISNDSTGNVKVTVSKTKSAKANARNSAVTVVGIDASDADTTDVDSISSSHGSASFTFDVDDDDFPFGNYSGLIGSGVLITIISIVAVFGLPVFILFIIFFFRYKNRKARYRLAEQALAAGQPLPENFIKEYKPVDHRSQGIKNTFTGIGLFIFLWAITGSFGIGTIGLLVMFTGIGEWYIGSKQSNNSQEKNTEKYTEKNDEDK